MIIAHLRLLLFFAFYTTLSAILCKFSLELFTFKWVTALFIKSSRPHKYICSKSTITNWYVRTILQLDPSRPKTCLPTQTCFQCWAYFVRSSFCSFFHLPTPWDPNVSWLYKRHMLYYALLQIFYKQSTYIFQWPQNMFC